MTDYILQIGDYLEGSLSEAARQAFEDELSTNDELRRAVDNHDVMEKVLDLLWEDDARQVALQAREEVIKKAKRDSMLRGLAIAAGLLVLVAISFLLFNQLDNSEDIIYANFYSPFMGNQSRGASDISALDLCEQGHMRMDNKEYAQAIDLFKRSIQNKEDCAENSEWYLLLAFIKQKNTTARDRLLKDIINDPSHQYHDMAKDLMSQLE